VDIWESGLAATAGAIVLEKMFWYLIDFSWHRGQWRYKSIMECPGELSARDIEGQRRLLRRVEVDQAEETLGVFLAPTGTLTGQLNKFNAKIQQWTEKLAAGRLSKSEMWTAVQSTILRTLAYPLPAINVTRQDWDKTLGPLLTTVLPRLGVCRHFPRAMVFAPTKYFGLGFRHLHTDQEIQRLKDLVFHTANDTITGRLYRASLELMHIELGSFLPLHRHSLELFSSFVTEEHLGVYG
jgi:hypothetical protein